MALINLFLAFALIILQGALGANIVCEELPVGICSFAISSTGNRCLLETTTTTMSSSYASSSSEQFLQCRTSPVHVLMMNDDNLREHIENDNCIRSCGLDRNSLGISSDALLDPFSVSKICSSACSDNCPNILDLYHNLARAEGVSLPDLCKALRTNPRRAMFQVLSSGGAVASGPALATAEGPCSDDAAYPPTASEP